MSAGYYDKQTAWLIESGTGKYWDGSSADPIAFVRDSNAALRFAREVDAKKVISGALAKYEIFLTANEHEWPEPSP